VAAAGQGCGVSEESAVGVGSATLDRVCRRPRVPTWARLVVGGGVLGGGRGVGDELAVDDVGE